MSKKTKDLDYLAMLSSMLRAREASMLGRDRMDRMLAAGSYAEAAKLLAECGYEDLSGADAAGIDAALTKHRNGDLCRARGHGPAAGGGGHLPAEVRLPQYKDAGEGRGRQCIRRPASLRQRTRGA